MNLITRGNYFDMDKFFDDFWAPAARQQTGETFFAPRVDVKDMEDHYQITAELPGVKKDDIHINLEDGILTLEAESSSEDKEEKEGKVIRQERRYGKFMRSFNLGSDVHHEQISANFSDGILTLKAPKHVEPPPKVKRIAVN